MNPACRVPWHNPRIVLTLLLVFFAGSVAGAMAIRMAAHASPHKSAPYWREGGKEISLQRFKKELNLRSDQAEQIEGILDDFVMYYQTLQAQMDEVRANGKGKILRILDPQQRQKFEKMMNDLQARQMQIR